MSLEIVHEQRHWGNQYHSPWTDAAKNRLRYLWSTTLTVEEIASALFREFNHRWSQQSLSWKADRLRLPARHKNTIWGQDAINILRQEWGAGEDTRRIADLVHKATGIIFTKNAVIGKAHRLGLERHKRANRRFLNAVEREIHRKNVRREWERNRPSRPNRYNRRIAGRILAPSVEDFSIPTPQRKTIFELSAHDCRWPVGEPQSDSFFFCGAVTEKDRPYCSSHCRRAYVEIRPR